LLKPSYTNEAPELFLFGIAVNQATFGCGFESVFNHSKVTHRILAWAATGLKECKTFAFLDFDLLA